MHPQDLVHPSWSCFHFVEAQEADRVVQLLAPEVTRAEVDGSRIASDQDLFGALKQAFRFPDYFGMNWDALDECLRDLSWLPSKNYVLVVRNAQRLWTGAYRTAGKLLEAWIFSAEEWSKEGVGFHLVFC